MAVDGKNVFHCMRPETTSLKYLLAHMKTKGSSFSYEELLKICLDISLGLNYLHFSGIIHGGI